MPTVPGALQVRGRPRKLTLAQRMDIRRRVKTWVGSRRTLFEALAVEHGVSVTTIERAVYG